VEDLKPIIAKNITALRQNAKLTQSELADRLNYSDKAISKWERAESIPDISVLKSIADLFGVTVDDLLRSGNAVVTKGETMMIRDIRHRNHTVITALSVLLAWFIATFCFVMLDILGKQMVLRWLPFLYAVPVSMIVWLVFNSIWFNTRRNYMIISLLMWTVLLSIVISLLAAGFSAWTLLVLGIPGQVIIFVWSRLQSTKR
jgi:transcriptional regulator with XRE-family HTH domain